MRKIYLTAVALCLAASASPGAIQGKAKTKPAGKPAAKAPAAPAAKLTTKEFPDGTGAIGLPAGWTIEGSYRGTVACHGPKNSRVSMGNAFVIARPDHPANNLGIQSSAPLARDGDLVNALKGVLKNADNKLIRLRMLPAPVSPLGSRAAYFLYELESKGKRYTALGYFTAIADNDFTLPYWQLYCSAVMAPKESFVSELPTLMAIWNSYTTNGKKPREGSDGALLDAAIADGTRRRAQTLKEQQEMFDRMNARFRETL